MLINKCPLLSAFILGRCVAGIPSGAKVESVSPNPWVLKKTGHENIRVDFPLLVLSYDIFLLSPLNLNCILLTHFDCLNVWLKILGIVTDSIIIFALCDRFILFKAPFHENLNLFVLLLWVNATVATPSYWSSYVGAVATVIAAGTGKKEEFILVVYTLLVSFFNSSSIPKKVSLQTCL